MDTYNSLQESDKQEVVKKDVLLKIFTLVQILRIIDTASNRGAFKGNELSFVGAIYDSIAKGVEQGAKQYVKESSSEESLTE